MKKILYLISAVVISTSASAQIVVDTITTGTGYLNQQYYQLSTGAKKQAGAKIWHVAFCSLTQQPGMSIRFNSLIGDLRFLPNGDPDASLTTVDTTGWSAESRLVDQDSNYFIGAFDQNAGSSQLDYSWGEYNQTSHTVNAKRLFGALIGTDFYVMKFSLTATTNTFHITYIKLGDANETTYDLNSTSYASKNYIYTNLIDKSVLDLEPKTSEWDLFFGQYVADVGGGQYYPVAGVLNNLKTEVVKVITHDAVNQTPTGNEVFSKNNNIINYTWKNAGPGGVTVADTVVFFMKATDGAVWKLRFTGFISASAANLPGSYILEKQIMSAVGLDKTTQTFMEMYPNPANDMVQIIVDAQNNTEISVFSLTGEQVYSTSVSNGLQNVQVNTADLSNGIYQVVVSSNGNQTTKKLVVNH
jgi:hypothetical protein